MATVTHYIYSHYDPAEREKLEGQTGQTPSEEDISSDPWQTESSFAAQRRLAAPPRFVPATISYDEWGQYVNSSKQTTPSANIGPGGDYARWYRSLTSSGSRAASSFTNSHFVQCIEPKRPSTSPRDGRTSSREVANKNNWFIMRAIRSEPSTAPSTPPPTLADILARDPPPLPTEERYVPPVFLALGPSNKGWSMLQQSGWKEGEGLGAHVTRSTSKLDIDKSDRSTDISRQFQKRTASVEHEITKTDVQESREVIDLTLSDDTESSGDEDPFAAPSHASSSAAPIRLKYEDVSAPKTDSAFAPRSLLTPLPTILKADRLGIGLKAKTQGPYKESRKRVTHNAAALAAHIKAAEEMRRRKAEVGRGRRGFERVRRKDEEKRKELLAYFNR